MIQTFKTRLIKKERLTDKVYLLEFKNEDPDQIHFQAGQYMMMLCPQPDGTNLSRLYSIASHPNKHDTFELLFEMVPEGVASNYVSAMNLGDEVQFRGPAGMFILKRNNHRVFLATGTGIAPIRSILHDIVRGNARTEHTTFLFWGVKFLKDVYFLEELKSFTKEHPAFEFFICLSQEPNLHSIPEEDRKHFILGRVTAGMEKRIGRNIIGEKVEFPPDFDYYLCGGRVIIEFLRQHLYEEKIPKEHVIFEKF